MYSPYCILLSNISDLVLLRGALWDHVYIVQN